MLYIISEQLCQILWENSDPSNKLTLFNYKYSL